MPWILVSREERMHMGKQPCDHGVGDGSDAAISQGMLRFAGAPGARKRPGRMLPRAIRGSMALLVSDFQPARMNKHIHIYIYKCVCV